MGNSEGGGRSARETVDGRIVVLCVALVTGSKSAVAKLNKLRSIHQRLKSGWVT
jgi:hypothetical protein